MRAIEKMLPASEIATQVRRIASEIDSDYTNAQNLVLVCVLKGAVMFAADLSRQIQTPHELHFVSASSYGAKTTSSGTVTIRGKGKLAQSVTGKRVIILDDIIDTGRTLETLVGAVRAMNPESVATAVLLDKPARREVPLTATYAGFCITDRFVIGYGLDYDEKYRHLPYIGVLSL